MEYGAATVTYPASAGPFVLRTFNGVDGGAPAYVVYSGVALRVAPQLPVMQSLFETLVAASPRAAGRVDCYNRADGDYGFTYRRAPLRVLLAPPNLILGRKKGTNDNLNWPI